jgi:hypothetical protein
MATEQTAPKVRMLFTIGVVSVFLLVSIKYLLDSYYLDMTESYEHTLLPKTTARDELRAKQMNNIDKGQHGTIPVSVAMQMLASKGRDSVSTDITPQVSDDPSPLEGWAQLKRTVHLPPQRTADVDAGAPEAADGGAEAADAGAVPAATDAGAVPAATDAGVKRRAPRADGGVRHMVPPQHPQGDGGK